MDLQSIQKPIKEKYKSATEEQLSKLQKKTEQYCVVMQTLTKPPKIRTKWGD